LIIPAGKSKERFVGHRPGTEVHWQANRHLWFQADYGIFYAGTFVNESQSGRNLNYWAYGRDTSLLARDAAKVLRASSCEARRHYQDFGMAFVSQNVRNASERRR
jgi:hypothetical protein